MVSAEHVETLNWESELWEGGYRRIAGVDEVGRGALAGPLVAAAVILPITVSDRQSNSIEWMSIRDSKTLTHRRRTILSEWIHASGASVSITEVSCQELDAIGLAAANRIAMERAVWLLAEEPDMLLIDAMTLDLHIPQIGIINGDALSRSIAAASIVAKVHRDAIMTELDAEYPGYGFARHKGYGVPEHLTALREFGPCPCHRRCFLPVQEAVVARGA